MGHCYPSNDLQRGSCMQEMQSAREDHRLSAVCCLYLCCGGNWGKAKHPWQHYKGQTSASGWAHRQAPAVHLAPELLRILKHPKGCTKSPQCDWHTKGFGPPLQTQWMLTYVYIRVVYVPLLCIYIYWRKGGIFQTPCKFVVLVLPCEIMVSLSIESSGDMKKYNTYLIYT